MRKAKLSLLMVLLCGSLVSACSDDNRMDDKIMPTALTNSRHSMINGDKDLSDAHKAVVSLYMKMSGDSYSACTGTLIHPQWVITAAHCVAEEKNGKMTASSYNKYYKIAFGNTESELKKNLWDIDKIYFHEGYGDRDIDSNYGTVDRDIALVKLKKAVPESVAKPILPLPKWLGLNRQAIIDGVTVEFSGFGYDEHGNSGTKIKFSSLLSNYCGTADNDSSKGCKLGPVTVNGCHPDKSYCSSWYYQSYCSNGYFCLKNYTDYVWLPQGSLYYEQDDGGPCQGDSGGPAFIKVGGVEYVAGLTSYGDAACAKTGISTAVQDYHDWILGKAPELASIFVEVCGNGIDDDGNGLVDEADSACGGVVLIDDGGSDPVDDGDDPVIDNSGDDPVIDGGNNPAAKEYIETFDAAGNDSSRYVLGSFVGSETGVAWKYENGRTDLGQYAIDGNGLMFRTAGSLTGTVQGGVSKVSLDVRKGFSSSKSRVVNLLVNGTVCNSIELGNTYEVQTLSCANVNLSGDVRISVTHEGQQTVIDNLRWTAID